MAADKVSRGWLLFLAQLPRSPSSARVWMWRRLRARGAAGILNGAWILPDSAGHAAFLGQLQETVRRRGGRGLVLAVPAVAPATDAMIVECFRADRAREYDEFDERCCGFLAEIGREAGAGKFIFAELEENEQDLAKLVRWLGKIRERDFFPDERWARSGEAVERCRLAFGEFSRAVYEAEDAAVPVRGTRPERITACSRNALPCHDRHCQRGGARHPGCRQESQ